MGLLDASWPELLERSAIALDQLARRLGFSDEDLSRCVCAVDIAFMLLKHLPENEEATKGRNWALHRNDLDRLMCNEKKRTILRCAKPGHVVCIVEVEWEHSDLKPANFLRFPNSCDDPSGDDLEPDFPRPPSFPSCDDLGSDYSSCGGSTAPEPDCRFCEGIRRLDRRCPFCEMSVVGSEPEERLSDFEPDLPGDGPCPVCEGIPFGDDPCSVCNGSPFGAGSDDSDQE